MAMRFWVTAALPIAIAACAPGFGARRVPSGAIERLPVLLVLEGDTTSDADAERITAAFERRLERPVVTTRTSAVDAAELAAHLRERYGRVPSGSWATDRCAAGEAAAQALAHDATAHYRLILRRRSTTVPATADDRSEASVVRRAAARVLGGVGVADADRVRDERIDGQVIATTFGRRVATRRLVVRASARELAPMGTGSLNVADVVARAIEPLRPPPYPLWDSLARQLLGRGCSLAALAVYDARLQRRPESRDVMRAALGNGPSIEKATPSVVATPAPGAAPPPVEEPAARVSCKALCELHMVELCNNDRELWSRHRRQWEATPCGQMRAEQFLRECYQRQWLTGTYQEACITPCEDAHDGRARLLHLLQGEGCARTPPS